MELANDFKLEVAGPRILDICAGIGILSFCKLHFQYHEPEGPPNITCVEINPDYVRVGQKLLPEAEWICADIFDIWRDLPRDFTCAIANPQLGGQKQAGKAPRYTGSEFEYKIIVIDAHLAGYGAFIIPQNSAPFRYSGAPYYQRHEHERYLKLAGQTGIHLDAGCGIDTTVHEDGWKHSKIRTEIVPCEFPHVAELSHTEPDPIAAATNSTIAFERIHDRFEHRQQGLRAPDLHALTLQTKSTFINQPSPTFRLIPFRNRCSPQISTRGHSLSQCARHCPRLRRGYRLRSPAWPSPSSR
jgi:predicted RNA methylase